MSDKHPNFNNSTIEGRNNTLRRIFTNAGIEPPADQAKWRNAMYWLERAYEDGRAMQLRVDSESIDGYYAKQAKELIHSLPSTKQGMEIRPEVIANGW